MADSKEKKIAEKNKKKPLTKQGFLLIIRSVIRKDFDEDSKLYLNDKANRGWWEPDASKI